MYRLDLACLNYAPRQDRIDQGILIRWTKGFGATDTEGQDVAAMFRNSLEKYVCYCIHFNICIL